MTPTLNTENTENEVLFEVNCEKAVLLGEDLPHIAYHSKQYGVTYREIVKMYVLADVYRKIGESFENVHHYCFNNKFTTDGIRRFQPDAEPSRWYSPLTFENGLIILDLNEKFKSEIPLESDVMISMFNSEKEKRYFLIGDRIVDNARSFDDEFLKYLVSFRVDAKTQNGDESFYLAFFSKDEEWLERIRPVTGEVYFTDVEVFAKYESEDKPSGLIPREKAGEEYFAKRKLLLEYLDSLTNHPTVTPGLELANTRALKLFDELYMKPPFDTMAERKKMFREMSGPTSRSMIYTQKGSSFLLKKLDEVCKKHDIKYWMYNGALLGACRHGTFIPWDDDIDVGMMRSDIKKLTEILSSDPNFTVDVLYNFEWADRIYKFRFKNTELPNYVDIFPFDYCEDEDGKTWDKLKVMHSEMIKDFRKKSEEIGHWYRSTFDVKEEHLAEFNKLFDHYAERAKNELGITDEPSKNIIYGFDTCYIVWWHQIYEVEKVFPLSSVNFDGHDFSAFGNAEEILVKNYKKPYTLPKDIVSHRHTARVGEDQIAKLEELMEKLRDYKF